MAEQITQTITPAPDYPDRAAPSTFWEKASAFLAWLVIFVLELIGLIPQVNAVSTAVNGYADDAEAAKTAAENARDAAIAAGSATIYNAGTTYAAGDMVLDPSDSYRPYTSQQGSNTGHTPGSDDGTWWKATLAETWERKTSNFAVVSGKRYKVAAGITATLPAAPVDNAQVWFSPLGDMTASNATFGRNGKKIMGLAEDLIWNANVPIAFLYDDTLGDWRFA